MSTRPLRVLHVLGSMGYGGVETWLMHLVKKLDRARIQIDFATTGAVSGVQAEEAETLGCKVIPCPLKPGVLTFGRRLERLLAGGSYDIVHSHNYLFSGYILRVAVRAGVPIRIAHIYPTVDLRPQTFWRKRYRALMTSWINRHGNYFLADSKAALDAFWPERVINGKLHHVLYCGIDLGPYGLEISKEDARRKFGLPVDRPIVLNVGRFVPHKNQRKLVEIAQGVLRDLPEAVFVMAGSGPLLTEVQESVSSRGLAKSFYFLQSVPDLTTLWKAADVFVFPTLMEGFGIVVVEAAASGLPVVASDIPGVREAAQACVEVQLVPPQDIGAFVAGAVRYLKDRRSFPPDLQKLAPFSIEASVASLVRVYSTAMQSFSGDTAF